MTNKISMDKKYRTADGVKVNRVFCIDALHESHPVVAELGNGCIYRYDPYGKAQYGVTADLVEVLPYEDFKIDDKVMVSNNTTFWQGAHFAGVNSEGEATIWRNGATSWSSSDSGVHPVRYCRKPTAEELAK